MRALPGLDPHAPIFAIVGISAIALLAAIKP